MRDTTRVNAPRHPASPGHALVPPGPAPRRGSIWHGVQPHLEDAGEKGPGLLWEKLSYAPSQKELALVFRITTRHLRRWEEAEASEGRQCSRPYNRTDLWNLYLRRGGKGWDREQAQRLGLGTLFVTFDQIASTPAVPPTQDDRSAVASLLLRSLSADETEIAANHLPRAVTQVLTETAKKQISRLMACEKSRALLVRAFLEGALIADVESGQTP